ncbi:hypothetical protein RUM43_003319 [Polyplax serrata]|uniref:Uncharacterized protein n=1 Tax=Polyplax serrata TaxID=468196 RepID=A0AAN8PP58_POLSC
MGCTKTRECPYPVLRQNGSEMAIDVVRFLSGIAEVKFNGAFDKVGSKRYCKIKCISGEWVGPLCLLDGEKGPGPNNTKEGKFHPVLRSCNTNIFQSKFIVSHRNRTVWEARNLSHNSVVQVRCQQFGVYKLIGDAHLICHNGVWKHRIPTCIATTSLTNFTDDSAPPSVLAKVTSGSASIEPTGELAVYPGSTVHLECLYLRSSGEPEWSWTSTYRTYTTGWSIDPEERQWKFRLSIFYIKPQDTGIYTCSTPKGLTNSIILNVIEVHCDVEKVLTNDPNVLIQIQGSRLGQSATYKCREGFKLNGVATITCQASGVWSGYAPQCVPIVCPELQVQNSSLKLVKQDFGFGGTATFQCPPGQKLVGVATLVCLLTGEWSGKMPTCKEVFCAPPLIPQNGRLKYDNDSVASSFRAGSELAFTCKGSYKIVGKENIKCQESGVWSNPPPFCKAYCRKPEDPPQGTFGPRKTEYDVGDRISLICYRGYEQSSKVRPKCMKNGTWSDVGLECRPKKTFRLTDRKKTDNVIVIEKPVTRIATTTTTITMSPTTTMSTTTTTTSTTTTTTTTTTEVTTQQPRHTEDISVGATTEVLWENFDDYNVTEHQGNDNDTEFFYIVDEQPSLQA